MGFCIFKTKLHTIKIVMANNKMKNRIIQFLICFVALFVFLTSGGFAEASANETVYLGGYPTGFNIIKRGADVVGLSDVITDYGVVSPCKNAGIKAGDRILSINNVDINSSNDIQTALSDNDNRKVVLIIVRGGEKIIKEVEPCRDIHGEQKLGLFVRDNLSGIGTMTFIRKNGEFMALGHPIVGEDEQITDIVSGEIFKCSITGVNKGVRGKAGELRGVFIKNDAVGRLNKNLVQGIKGVVSNNYAFDNLTEVQIGTAKVGNAKMVTSIMGSSPTEYDISIVKTDDGEKDCKNLVIKVNDERLLKTAGGIVQGMSGSPILQNGKLVGAVTHVFLNDPTRGYGICINNMLNAN